MNFPIAAFQKIINYLTTGQGTIPELVKAATEIINWATDLIWSQGLVTVQAAAPVDHAGRIAGLQWVVDQHSKGVVGMQLAVPQWLIPILLELLKKWLAP